ncbi:restriction endonuclease subunit S [Sphingobacterium litopenaei]|uniref:Restriction endonuclease subunit S n=1 Tax=Sphingobacterium litopenaei TaxID=2763500 RepID=A0ABR7YB50_9SPHI|nr:restriction endonuclease subunit S [Sphingobacterium litopenaei]MBD1428509.1 restriction endonuclease subunit S [Sphingobacterium litopenaei]
MSKIDDLITKYCPDGVEWKDLGECGKIIRGKRVTKSQLNDDKKYPVISGGFKPLGYFDDYNREANTITIAQYGSAGYLDWQKERFWANDVCYSVYPNEGLNNRFLYFILSSKQDLIYSLKTNAIPAHLPQNLLEKITIPIPPLPVQEEIVSILDKFTALEAELEAELEARTRQYEYYRNELLSFDGKDVEWKALGEVGEFIRGKRFVRTDMVEEGYPCIHYGEMYTHYNIYATESKSFIRAEQAEKLRKAKKGDVVIVAAGETIEDIGKATAWLGESDVVTHDACFTFRSSLNPKFVAYFSRTKLFHDQIKKNISSGKISAINAKGLEKAKIPVPSIEEQERIVAILDKFDALVNDISTGLPAEIQARRQQYEYYRGKLLTFEHLTA